MHFALGQFLDRFTFDEFFHFEGRRFVADIELRLFVVALGGIIGSRRRPNRRSKPMC